MVEIILAAIAGIVVAPVVGGLAYRTVRRRRIARSLAIDTPNGIVEGRYVRIGGAQQWIQIRGEDRANPVLLVVHGGPGSPYAIFTPLLRSWEKHFTVVQWDRRGAGRTMALGGKAGSGEMTFDRMAADGIEVAEFLRAYLRTDKLILMAGSMGTLVGLPMVKRRPDLFAAYVGTDFYVDLARNEAASYRMTLERLRAAGNAKGVAALERIGADPSRWDVRAWGVKMAWSFRTDPVTPGLDMKLVIPLTVFSPAYTLRDVVRVAVGFEYSKAAMFEQFMAFDARRLGTRFEVPFFIFQGAGDVITLTGPAQEYFAEVEAPVKGLALIEDASHFCAFARPDRFLTELLTRVRPLATGGCGAVPS